MRPAIGSISMLVLMIVPLAGFPQSIMKGSILINGSTREIRFVNINNESYLSWSDLQKLLPSIFSISQNGEIIVNPLATNPLTPKDLRNLLDNSVPTGGDVVESRIDGDFEGWDGDTIFKLMNGQIWQQAEYKYTYHYAFMPEVLIYKSSSGWKMKVDGASDEIRVRRIK